MVKITHFPERIFLERGVFGQSANFEFRLQTDSTDVMELEELTADGFDKQDQLLFRLPLNNWGIVPSISVVFERKLLPSRILEIFNPLADYPLDYPIHRLRYSFCFRTEKGDHVRSEISVEPMIYEQKAALILPFSGTCLVTDGHNFLSHHRLNFPLTHPLIQQIGITGNNSRFAYDFVLLDNEFKMFKNTPRRNEDFFCWGKPVLCPGEGRISSVASEVPDNPLYEPPPFDEETHIRNPDAAMERHVGNHVIIDHGNDEFSVVAHMQKDSVRAKAGDRVVEGETIGAIGNSGDSGSPHIHYQLQNGRDLRRSEGLPSRFRRFDLILGNRIRRLEGICPSTGMIIKTK
ncbi:MAG: M23 family metallopeptidase [Candidatus Atabeyarchaeum deiterrae]